MLYIKVLHDLQFSSNTVRVDTLKTRNVRGMRQVQEQREVLKKQNRYINKRT